MMVLSWIVPVVIFSLAGPFLVKEALIMPSWHYQSAAAEKCHFRLLYKSTAWRR